MTGITKLVTDVHSGFRDRTWHPYQKSGTTGTAKSQFYNDKIIYLACNQIKGRQHIRFIMLIY
jgi:hypothetical protein